MTTESADFADTVTLTDAAHASAPGDFNAAYADTTTLTDAVVASLPDTVAHYADTVTVTDAVVSPITWSAHHADTVTLTDAFVAAGPPAGDSEELFSIGVVALDVDEPFTIQAANIVVSVDESFDIEGNAAVDSTEPFNLGPNLAVDYDEPFSLLAAGEGVFSGGHLASPQIGYRSS